MTKIKKTDGLAWRVIEGRTYIVDASSSMLHELDETGTFIWKLIDASKSRETILKELLANFDVPDKTAESDLDDFLNVLAQKSIITII